MHACICSNLSLFNKPKNNSAAITTNKDKCGTQLQAIIVRPSSATRTPAIATALMGRMVNNVSEFINNP